MKVCKLLWKHALFYGRRRDGNGKKCVLAPKNKREKRLGYLINVEMKGFLELNY